MVSLFEMENVGFKITMFSAYLKNGLPGCVLNQFCNARRYFNAGVPVCVFLQKSTFELLLLCFTDVDVNVMSVCQMSVEVISAPYHLIFYSRSNSIAGA